MSPNTIYGESYVPLPVIELGFRGGDDDMMAGPSRLDRVGVSLLVVTTSCDKPASVLDNIAYICNESYGHESMKLCWRADTGREVYSSVCCSLL